VIEVESISDSVKKNVLDLQYNKYLQYYNTSIIILFTYVIGAGIALLTEQLNLTDHKQVLSLGLISTVIIAICILSMLYFKNHQQNILYAIKKLKL